MMYVSKTYTMIHNLSNYIIFKIPMLEKFFNVYSEYLKD